MDPSTMMMMAAALKAGSGQKQPQSSPAVPVAAPGESSQATAFNPNAPTGEGSGSGYYDLMLGLSDLGSKEQAIKEQMSLANEMRKTPAPQMRDMGRVSVAAHPLEFVAAGADRVMGMRDRRAAQGNQAALANEIRRRIVEERARQQGQVPQVPQEAGDGLY